MAGWRGGATVLLLVVLCSVSLISAASEYGDVVVLNEEMNQGLRKLLQAVAPPPAATPPSATPPAVTPPSATPPSARVPPTPTPTGAVTPPTRAPAPVPIRPPVPAPAPVVTPAPPTPVRTYLMYVGLGAAGLVVLSVAVFCLCRKFGQQKIRGAQRLPPLPRYH